MLEATLIEKEVYLSRAQRQIGGISLCAHGVYADAI
jgi:hypothetical protein